MASNGNYFVYETIPYSYSPLRLASSCPLDNFDTLTRSMRDLTTYADHIARALAADTAQQSGTRIKSNASAKPSSGQSTPRAASADPVQLTLRPSIFSRHTPDGFVLSAATPGLRKDELKVELLDDQGESFIEVSGKTLDRSQPHTTKDADEPHADANNSHAAAKAPELRATYRGFSERVRLPTGVDREAMRARYEDGLLLVTIPMEKAEDVKRQKIAIA